MAYRRSEYQIHLAGPLMAQKLLLPDGHRVIGATYNPVKDTLEFVIAEGDRSAGQGIAEAGIAPLREGRS